MGSFLKKGKMLLLILIFLFALVIGLVSTFIFIGGRLASSIFSINETHAFIIIAASIMTSAFTFLISILAAYLNDILVFLRASRSVSDKKNKISKIGGVEFIKKFSNNKSCPCGSGKKYKYCCSDKQEQVKGTKMINEIERETSVVN